MSYFAGHRDGQEQPTGGGGGGGVHPGTHSASSRTLQKDPQSEHQKLLPPPIPLHAAGGRVLWHVLAGRGGCKSCAVRAAPHLDPGVVLKEEEHHVLVDAVEPVVHALVQPGGQQCRQHPPQRPGQQVGGGRAQQHDAREQVAHRVRVEHQGQQHPLRSPAADSACPARAAARISAAAGRPPANHRAGAGRAAALPAWLRPQHGPRGPGTRWGLWQPPLAAATAAERARLGLPDALASGRSAPRARSAPREPRLPVSGQAAGGGTEAIRRLLIGRCTDVTRALMGPAPFSSLRTRGCGCWLWMSPGRWEKVGLGLCGLSASVQPEESGLGT